MKRNAFSLCIGIAAAAALLTALNRAPMSAQSTPSAPASAPARTQVATDLTLNGCVTQGTAANTFILSNARVNPNDQKEKGRVYLIVAAADGVDIAGQVNHEVEATGTADSKTAPLVGMKYNERDLPRFSAKKVAMLADKCRPAISGR